MKRILITFLILALSLGLWAQQSDSILLQRVDVLKKELGVLKKQNQNLQARLSKLQKTYQNDLDKTNKKITDADAATQQIRSRTDELEHSLKESEEKALESVTILGDWTKKMILILAIIAVALFLILLIFVLANRRKILANYQKLEAKVDNTKELIDKQISDVLQRNEEDITALKALIEKDKK